MTKFLNECRSCGSILTIEHLIGPKVGTEVDVCLQCLVAAFEEVLREYKILSPPPPSVKSASSSTESAA